MQSDLGSARSCLSPPPLQVLVLALSPHLLNTLSSHE
jgi:hypothetical protein